MRNRAGMTLMELIVGLFLTSVMAVIGTATFGSIIDHRRAIQVSTTEMERAAALRETLRSWLASGDVSIQQGGGPRLTNRRSLATNTTVTAATASGDEITFTTSAPNPAMAPQVRIRLFIDADQSTAENGLSIEYQTSTAAPLQRRQLDPTIGSMTVEFLDARTHRWFSSTQASTISPSAVRVALFPAEGYTLPAILQLPMMFSLAGVVQ
jgi:Tfp pilus assembly protein PilE